MWKQVDSMCVQKGIDRKEVKKEINKYKSGKVANIDRITVLFSVFC